MSPRTGQLQFDSGSSCFLPLREIHLTMSTVKITIRPPDMSISLSLSRYLSLSSANVPEKSHTPPHPHNKTPCFTHTHTHGKNLINLENGNAVTWTFMPIYAKTNKERKKGEKGKNRNKTMDRKRKNDNTHV